MKWVWTMFAVAIFSTVAIGQHPEVTKETSAKWATTQNDIDSALHEQGTRTDGPEALKLLSEAVAAYRQALLRERIGR